MITLFANAQAEVADAAAGAVAEAPGLYEKITELCGQLSGFAWGLPFIFLLLGAGMVYTFRLGLLQFRMFGHAVAVVAGKYDDPNKPGDITHFQALCAALSATVGVGNIGGVATAVHMGGPGAIFWMWIAGFFGMATKYATCTLAQKYRKVNDDGSISGGPMYYIQMGLGHRFKWLAILFAVSAIIASFGGGNMVQSSQMADVASSEIGKLLTDQSTGETSFLMTPLLEDFEQLTPLRIFFGLAIAALVGLVIIGGIRRIGMVASKLVPGMAVLYCGGALFILFANFGDIPAALHLIVSSAMDPNAVTGGVVGATFLGVLTWGIKRAVFSNEAGLGSAPIAHAAAKTDEPVREGLVAMLGPFIDTLVICTMTALVLLISNAKTEPGNVDSELYDYLSEPAITEVLWADGDREVTSAEMERLDREILWRDKSLAGGANLTKAAFQNEIGNGFGGFVIALGLFLFAISTAISWSYYGDRCVEYVFGSGGITPYRYIFCFFLFLGTVVKVQAVWDFADFTMATMAFWNLIGVLALSGVIISLTRDYMSRDHKPFK